MKTISKKIFLIIFILTLLLRFYKLGIIPSGLDWDEVSNAYNAYSILKTGHDEYNNFLPLYNRSFDDYKPPLYMYLEVPSVAIFGLTPFAARLPSALLGSLSTIVIYLFVKRLFKKENLALVAMALAAISPWQLQFSRVGFEANIGLFTAVASFTLLLYSLALDKEKMTTKKIIIFLLSAIFFGLSFYSYHAERIFVPLLFSVTAIIYKKELLKFPKKYLAVFVILGIIIVAPFFIFSPKQAISQRFQETSSKSQIKEIKKSIKFIEEDSSSRVAKIAHNRRITILQGYLQNYFANLDINYLFVKGDDNLRHHLENMGMLYLIELPFLLYGAYIAIREKSRPVIFIMSWLFLSPIAAAPTDVAPHAIRSYTLVIALEIFIAIAIIDIYYKIKWKKVYLTLALCGFCISLFSYLENYYIHYPHDQSSWWQYGYLQAVAKTQELKSQYNKIYIDPSVEQAYIFWLFGTKFNPEVYHSSGNRDNFDKFYFSSQKPTSASDLLVTSAGHFPPGLEIVEAIDYPNGDKDLLIGHPKQNE
jgi:4-amino-4-deoxy-L-arabinose transferase-like glycosyltransferase